MFLRFRAAERLLLGHFKIQGLAAVGADGVAVQQGVLLHDGGRAAGGAGHLVLCRAVVGLLGGFVVILVRQSHLKGTLQLGQMASPASRSSSLT